MIRPAQHAVDQYGATTGNLTARIALHSYGTNPESWWSWLGPRLPRDGSVLEAGSGTGEVWRHLSCDRLTLTDFSPAMCERLREVPGARVLRCDATALPVRDGSVDTVIANHMLYHLDDPAAGLREFARVLRPGGRVAIATNGRDHMAELDALAAVPWPKLNGFTAETAPAIVGEYFTDVTVERYPGDLAVPDAEPVIAYLESMAPVSDGQRAAVRAEVAAAGVFRIRKHTVLITARRQPSAT